ncbi:MAG TPA: 6-phosphogluconolactonase [Bacteroidales bacterium]|nr:6-phosphogluconolactonase [Bacteroidales bacterium]
MQTLIKISDDQGILADELAAEISELVNKSASRKKPFFMALSGGTTPELLFGILGRKFGRSTDWSHTHIFWADERCVPPGDKESNYGMTRRNLLDLISIPESNIHRINGEAPPEEEAKSYSSEISNLVPALNGWPAFDLVLLGLGNDGHTASIFAGDKRLLRSEHICCVATHPVSGQKRITITGKVINNAFRVFFLVTGLSKADVVAEVIECPGEVDYPAASIEPEHGLLKWYLDNDAASMLNQWA